MKATTFHPENTFNQPSEKICEIMARPDVSPLGIGSAIKMVRFFKNRAGRSLPDPERLDKAIKLLHRQPPITHPIAKFDDLEIGRFFISYDQLRIKMSPTTSARSMYELTTEPFESVFVYKVPLIMGTPGDFNTVRSTYESIRPAASSTGQSETDGSS